VARLAQRFRYCLMLAAASMLLLNALVMSIASAHAADTMVDAFGNPLCITSADGDTAPADAGLPDCCTFGCGAVSLQLVAEDADDPLGVVRPRDLAVGFLGDRPAPTRLADYEPGNPRAPPLTI
jgi:hypothetical protein